MSEYKSISSLLDDDGAKLTLGRFSAIPEPTPYGRYVSAKHKLTHPYKHELVWESNNYNASCLSALKEFIEVVESAKKTFANQFSEVNIAAHDGYIQASVYKSVPRTAEELAEAQAIVDAGPPPEEKIQWRRPIKFQLNDAPSWNDPRGYVEMNPKKEEE